MQLELLLVVVVQEQLELLEQLVLLVQPLLLMPS
jgi:hypothetical protein